MNANWIAGVFVILLSLSIFVYRKKFKFHSFLGIFYFGMLRTQIGIKLMDKWAKRHKKLLHKLCYVMIGIGFIGMIYISFELIRSLVNMVTGKTIMAVGLVLPFQAKGIFYVPFFYWIAAVMFVIVVHEFSHGLIARLFKLKVKSTGIAFLGAVIPLIPGAFVEPDEKELSKAPPFQQLSVFAAGPFANILFGLVFLGMFLFIFTPMNGALYDYNGVEITNYISETSPAAINGMVVGDLITSIDGNKISKVKEFSNAFESKLPGDKMHIVTSSAIYDIKLADRAGNAFLGIYAAQSKNFSENARSYGMFLPTLLSWIIELVYWLAILNIGVGLFNLVPLGPIDGGRMFHTFLCNYVHKKHATTAWKAVSYVFLFVVVGSILFGFFV